MVTPGKYRSGAELRRKTRRQFEYSAEIATDGKTPVRACMICDISQTGARLVLDSDDELPEHFVLLLSRNGSARRRCRLIWRKGAMAGVEFAPGRS
jgi:hypothetical protein